MNGSRGLKEWTMIMKYIIDITDLEQAVEIFPREYQPSRLTTVDDLPNSLTYIHSIVQKYI